MIKSISIKNFQAHKDTHFDFGKITTIVGDSDKGKSAIIRALIWNITNKPNGTYFIRNGAKFAEVKVNVDDRTVTRFRAKTENSYTLDNTEFKAIKTDVPDEIKRVYNVSPNCIQQQHDSVFWFSSSPGDVAKQLNQIVDLDIIDYTLADIASQQRQAKGELDVLSGLRAEYDLKLQGSDKVESISAIVSRVDELEKNWQANNSQCLKIGGMIDKCNRICQQMEYGDNVASLNRDLVSACSEYLFVDGERKRISALIDRINDIGEINERVFSVPATTFDRIYSMQKELDSKRKSWKRIKSLLNEIDETETSIRNLSAKAKEFETQFHNILNGKKCPLCGKVN